MFESPKIYNFYTLQSLGAAVEHSRISRLSCQHYFRIQPSTIYEYLEGDSSTKMIKLSCITEEKG